MSQKVQYKLIAVKQEDANITPQLAVIDFAQAMNKLRANPDLVLALLLLSLIEITESACGGKNEQAKVPDRYKKPNGDLNCTALQDAPEKYCDNTCDKLPSWLILTIGLGSTLLVACIALIGVALVKKINQNRNAARIGDAS